MSLTQSKLSKARAHAARVGAELAVNVLLPFLIYRSTRESLGDVRALMVAAGPPIVWSVAGFIRARKADAISLLVLSGIALSLLAFAGGGGVKVLQLRENLVTGLIGLIFLGSILIGRPLIYQLARAGAGRIAPAAAASIEALRDDPGFRRAIVITTLAWALGLLAVSAVNCVLVFRISIQQFMLVGGPTSYVTMGLLTAWTSWYLPRAKRQAEARRALGAAG